MRFQEALQTMRRQFHSLTKQQNVKAELSSLKFQDFVQHNNGNRKLALRSLTSCIEQKVPLYPKEWQKESFKVEFLRGALLKENWAINMLHEITCETQFRPLVIKFESLLQIKEKAEGISFATLARSNYDDSKPTILFTAPRYAKKIGKELLPGSRKDQECLNCGIKWHRHDKCRKPLNLKVIAARKSEYFDEKKKKNNGNKRILHKVISTLSDILEIETEDDFDGECFESYFSEANNEMDTQEGYAPQESVGISFTKLESTKDEDSDF